MTRWSGKQYNAYMARAGKASKKRGKSTHLTQAQLATLEAQGIKLTESTRFTNVHYKPDENGINIYAGRCGQLQIDWNSLDDFIEELMEFQEVYDETYYTRRTG